MIQAKKKIQTSNLDLINPKESHLSIQFSLDGFSFCIFNKDLNTYTALYDYSFEELNNTPQKLLENITSVFNDEGLLQNKYDSVDVSHINELSTLVPKPLFDENKLSTYLSYNTKIYRHDYFEYDEIENHDIMNVYIPYVNINNFLIDKFGGFNYRHYSNILIESLLGIYKFSLIPQIFVHVHDNHFELVVIADKKLQLYNTFTYSSKEDYIYYILFTAEQLNLNPERFELFLLGDIEKDDKLYKIAYKYIRNVRMLENRSKYLFDEVFKENDKRTYYTLLNQY